MYFKKNGRVMEEKKKDFFMFCVYIFGWFYFFISYWLGVFGFCIGFGFFFGIVFLFFRIFF